VTLLRAADIRPGDSIETAPGEWTVAGRVTVTGDRARVEPDGAWALPLVLDDPCAAASWSVERPHRFALWHVRPGDDAALREVVWSHASA
jgi:hypothetical protein